jgi:NAD(P)H dehydrogenase (quinone)
MSVPVKIVVVYHSGYDHTLKIAEAVVRGAAAINGASVELVTAEEAPRRWALLDGADAIIMGAPTYMGSLSAPFKAFMDATSHLQYAEKRWAGKVAAGFTNGASRGGDKQNSLVQLMTFAAQHQMHWVNLGLNYGNNRSYTNENILNRDSYTLGMAGQADMDRSGDIAPPSSDLRTAEFLGRRVAEVAQELSIGRATLGRPARRGVAGGSENQDPEGRGVTAGTRVTGTPETKAALVPSVPIDHLDLSETLVKPLVCVASDEPSFSTSRGPNVYDGCAAN